MDISARTTNLISAELDSNQLIKYFSLNNLHTHNLQKWTTTVNRQFLVMKNIFRPPLIRHICMIVDGFDNSKEFQVSVA